MFCDDQARADILQEKLDGLSFTKKKNRFRSILSIDDPSLTQPLATQSIVASQFATPAVFEELSTQGAKATGRLFDSYSPLCMDPQVLWSSPLVLSFGTRTIKFFDMNIPTWFFAIWFRLQQPDGTTEGKTQSWSYWSSFTCCSNREKAQAKDNSWLRRWRLVVGFISNHSTWNLSVSDMIRPLRQVNISTWNQEQKIPLWRVGEGVVHHLQYLTNMLLLHVDWFVSLLYSATTQGLKAVCSNNTLGFQGMSSTSRFFLKRPSKVGFLWD